jgi:GDSL-like Lipase/Acylhydrolase family
VSHVTESQKLRSRNCILLPLLIVLSTLLWNAAHAQTQTVAYTANTNGPYGAVGYNGGLNIGHTFAIAGTNLLVFSLGVYDYAGDGLAASHTVTIFSAVGGSYVPVSGGSVTVPAGTSAPLSNSYRFQALSAPISLPPGNYAIIVYQMNGGPTSDPYSDDGGNNGFNGIAGFVNTGSLYEFTADPGPTFPSPGGGAVQAGENYGSSSFTYALASSNSIPVDAPIISPASVVVGAGQTVSLTASDNGTPPVSYQWYYGNAFAPIAGATNATLILTNVQTNQSAGNAGNYAVSAQNASGGPIFSANPSQASVRVIPVVMPIKIMPLGDSITDGFRAAGGYRAPLYLWLANSGFNFTFVGSQSDNSVSYLPYPDHEGISGSEINSVAAGFVGWGEAYTPDVILLLIGTNDYGYNDDTANATNRLDQLIELIATNQPNAKLVVANLTLRTDNASAESAIETTFNPFVPGIVASHAAMGQKVYFVDMHSVLGASDLADGLHPDQIGYDKLAAKWFTAITNIISPPPFPYPTLSMTTTNATLTYLGVPGFQYITQRSTNPAAGEWLSISTNTLPANGVLQLIDGFSDSGGTPPPAAFYRFSFQLPQ